MDQQKIVEDWNSVSEEWFANINYKEIFRMLYENAFIGFPKAIADMIKKNFSSLKNKKVLVPSSGDNIAVFAFALMGAKVTSTDIAENQLMNAKKISDEKNLEIEYVVSDTMKLEEFADNSFDLVYTSNGAHPWIFDLESMYKNINRVLKKNGKFIFFDTHPFSRPFDEKLYDNKLKVVKLYDDIGPFNEAVPRFEYRTQDFINAIAKSGLKIIRMEEFHSDPMDLPLHNYLHEYNHPNNGNYNWEINPWAALPQCLSMCCEKN
jgi:ubiquinone/menaquinone biosynthesis C-methylase UbiE